MNRLVATHGGRMKRMCLFLSCQDAYVAEEVYSELLVLLWNSLETMPGRQEEEADWIFAMARNTAVDFFRRRPKLNIVPLYETILNIATMEDENAMHEELYQLIDLLDDEERAIVMMKLGGWNAKEIGRRLGVSPKHINNRFSSIVKKMRLKYKQMNE